MDHTTLGKIYGTPLYIYDANAIRENYKILSEMFASTDLSVDIHFAVKANYNLSILHLLHQLGAGADVVSGGEMQRALTAGMPPDHIIFSGVAKTDSELRAALTAGIAQINLESAEELLRLQGIAQALGVTVQAAVRINPNVDANTHAKINTGKSEHKFGVDLQTARQMFLAARGSAVQLQGLAMHIGSQILDVTPFDAAFAVMAEFARDLEQSGSMIKTCDIGGGIGVPYAPHEKAADLNAFATYLKKHFAGFHGRLATEPGRFLVANAGVLLTQVEFIKRTTHKTFVVVDAAMNDLMRPAMYDAYHPITPLHGTGETTMISDIVGGICETSDIFARDRQLPENLAAGDFLCIGMAGAYGESMSNTYNARDLCAAVMVDGAVHQLVRKRWDIQAQMALESLAESDKR